MLPRRNPKKLKYQYKQPINSNLHDYFCQIYPSVGSSYFKKFSTYQERSFYFLHDIEYKSYSLKIRVVRGAGLANIWDDFSTYVYKVAKSWKHNSRRQH